MYGDFEDLETGEVYKAMSGKGDEAEVFLGVFILWPFCCISVLICNA